LEEAEGEECSNGVRAKSQRGGGKKVKGLSQWRLKAQAGGKRMQKQEVPLISESDKGKIFRMGDQEVALCSL